MEIIGFPDYLIYPDGLVYSKKGKGSKGVFLKQFDSFDGYKILQLDGKTQRVHRLVAIHFIPNPENKPQVDHINNIRNDNRVENLRWVCHQENMDNQSNNPSKNNKSGHKLISFDKSKDKWIFKKTFRKKYMKKQFDTKTDALWYKFIILLKIKEKII
jgi:hypothetical protein